MTSNELNSQFSQTFPSSIPGHGRNAVVSQDNSPPLQGDYIIWLGQNLVKLQQRGNSQFPIGDKVRNKNGVPNNES
jgi:hypothetical protein